MKSCQVGRPFGPIGQPELPVSPQQVRSQLAKVCASEEFQRSKRSLRFLNYIVEETLAGRAGRIKAYSVAISVLDRDDTFDPQTDPMVRIEASQLRRRLERYYLTQGVADPVVIDLPKGGYVPVFRPADVAVPPEGDWKPRPLCLAWRGSRAALASILGIAMMTAVIAAFAVLRISPAQPHLARFGLPPGLKIQVLSFSAATSDDRSAAVAAGLADEITQVLTRLGAVRVLSPTPRANGISHASADIFLTGSVRSNAGVIRLTASLIDARMGTYIWTEAYDMPADDPVLAIQTALAADLGSRLAAPEAVMAPQPATAQAESPLGESNLQ